MSSYEATILDHIQNNFLVETEALTVETSLIEEGIVDSLGIFRLISFLESTYGIEFEPADVAPDNFHNIQAIANFVLAKNGDGSMAG